MTGATAAPVLRPTRRIRVHEHADPAVLVLEVGERDVPLELPLSPRDAQALRLLSALHRRAPDPPVARAVHVDLLVRALQAGGDWRPYVLVRPGPPAAFWLRIERDDGAREVDMSPLDAVVMLLSSRVPVLLTDDPA